MGVFASQKEEDAWDTERLERTLRALLQALLQPRHVERTAELDSDHVH